MSNARLANTKNAKSSELRTSATSLWLALACVFMFIGGLVLGALFMKGSKNGENKLLTINQELDAQHKITPDIFSTTLKIESTNALRQAGTLSQDEQDRLLNTLNAINQLSIDAKSICSDGGYVFTPQEYHTQIYSYGKYKNKRYKGYQASQHIVCEFSEAQKAIYDKLLNGIRSLLSNNPYLQSQIPKITPVITKDQIRAKTQDMRNEILKKARDITKDYGKVLRTNCAITTINFNDYEPIPRRLYTTPARQSILSPQDEQDFAMPIARADDISISASFTIGCEL